MFKKIALLGATLAISAGTLLADATSVAVIDMNSVISSFSKTPPALKSLEADYKLATQNEKETVEQLNKKQEELQKLAQDAENPLRSETAKMKAKKDAQELYQKIMKERQEFLEANAQIKKMLDEKRVKMLNDLVAEIKPVIDEYASENKIDVIVNTANGVIFASEKANITKAVIEKLAKKFPPAPDATPSPAPAAAPDAAPAK